MAWIPSARAAAAVVVAVAALSLAACSGGTQICPCPSGGAQVAVPSAQTTTIDSVETEPPCTATGAGTPGSGTVQVNRPSSGTCQVRVALGNGDTYAFSVQFASGGGCCGSLAYAIDASVPQLVDAGAGSTD